MEIKEMIEKIASSFEKRINKDLENLLKISAEKNREKVKTLKTVEKLVKIKIAKKWIGENCDKS